jgi:hypothetical protein
MTAPYPGAVILIGKRLDRALEIRPASASWFC